MAEPTLTVELLERIRNGDADARERLLVRYQPRIFQIVRMLIGDRMRRRVESADLVQETLLEAVQRLDGFEPQGPGSLLAWFKKLARSAVCAEADRAAARKRIPDRALQSAAGTADDDTGIEPAGDATGPLRRAEQDEESEHLEQCIAALAEADRDLILLRNYAEQSWAEVAAETGHASANAARVAYATAKARLVVLVQRPHGTGAAG
jgi:RNA polymerase sigma factor (sigma-70 family)